MGKEREKGSGQERWEGEEGGGVQTAPGEMGEREKRSKEEGKRETAGRIIGGRGK